MTNSPSAGGAAESLPSTSPSRTRSNAQDVKQSISTFKSSLETLINNPAVFTNQDCYVGQVLAAISTHEAELLKTALADARIRHVDLVRLCEAEGYKMSEGTMRRHRSKSCRCIQ